MAPAVVFPGQGTQRPGMGAPWRDHPAWMVVERAEAALGEPVGRLLLDAGEEDLGRTRNAQLAVLLTSLVAWDAIRDSVPAPVAFAGHSLGQVTALIASGLLGFEDGLAFAAIRAERTQAAADARPGRMAALVGAEIDQATTACEGVEAWVANDNAPGQVVVAGTPEGLDAAVARAKDLGVRRALPLPVGGAFHTPLMRPATEALQRDLASCTFNEPSAPVVANDDGGAHAEPEPWRDRSARHVSAPVRWRTVQETLARLGATSFVEVGHGTMLASLAKRTVPSVEVIGVGTPGDAAALAPGSPAP